MVLVKGEESNAGCNLGTNTGQKCREPQSRPEVPFHAVKQAIFHLHQAWSAAV
jgi:hypothetical protein